MTKVLVATEKPFAKAAVDGIKDIVEAAGFEFALLEKYADRAELLAAVADASALIIRSDKVTSEVIAAAPELKIVVRAGAGYDNVDLVAATEAGVTVMNTPGQNANAVAELAIGMMVFMSRGQFNPGTGCEISRKKLGIHAYGNVGKLVAKYGKAFGMTVYAFDPFVTDDYIFNNDGVIKVNSVEELYSTCDFVSLHIPETPSTIGSINYDLLNLMPQGGMLVNTARKSVIDAEGLDKLLADRPDMKYASDIITANHAELVEHHGKRVFGTSKKMGAETFEANVNAALAAANQIVAFIKDGVTRFKVN